MPAVPWKKPGLSTCLGSIGCKAKPSVRSALVTTRQARSRLPPPVPDARAAVPMPAAPRPGPCCRSKDDPRPAPRTPALTAGSARCPCAPVRCPEPLDRQGAPTRCLGHRSTTATCSLAPASRSRPSCGSPASTVSSYAMASFAVSRSRASRVCSYSLSRAYTMPAVPCEKPVVRRPSSVTHARWPVSFSVRVSSRCSRGNSPFQDLPVGNRLVECCETQYAARRRPR